MVNVIITKTIIASKNHGLRCIMLVVTEEATFATTVSVSYTHLTLPTNREV